MDRYKFASVYVKQDWSDCIGAALLHLLSFGQKKDQLILFFSPRVEKEKGKATCRVGAQQIWFAFI
jgi:hypothetical protein